MTLTYSEYLAANFRCSSFRVLSYDIQRNLPITEKQNTKLFFHFGHVFFLQLFEFWTLGTPVPLDCKGFSDEDRLLLCSGSV